MYTRSETVFTGVSDNEENDKIIASIARYTAEPVQAESEGVLSFCTSVYRYSLFSPFVAIQQH